MDENQSNSDERQMQDAVMGADSGNFFDDLDRSVNKEIFDDNAQDDSAASEQVTSEPIVQNSEQSEGVDWDSDSNPYKKGILIHQEKHKSYLK